MLLGLTILLVLLAWTLGNTISRSTNRPMLDAPAGHLLHRKTVLQVAWWARSSFTSSVSYAIGLLRHIEMQPELASPARQRNGSVETAALTGHFSDCCALLIGRNSDGFGQHPSLTARVSSCPTWRPRLRTRRRGD